ncbi:MAG: TIGR01459 family HAD-type hydrolase [Defluviimonas sp.]|uniref:TIGR01459 family HAD-type hydrolase n=1 Tax=Albidovulum sp. TaxID=1872424 RepID=UPI001D9E62BA|nr:TIGR01459 family HAD-type hydrolase [Paracoccaceae bacterium]MCC0063335.1 TIGR01459 family HAD-type hydrolase [Defluviimonas sp.]
MTRIIQSLAELSTSYDTLLCDLWGCLHNGRQPYPEAVAALQGFRARGGAVALLTNAPRPGRFVVEQLHRMGVPRDAWDLVVSSGDAAQIAMLRGAVGRHVHHIGPAKDDGFFTALPDEPDDLPTIVRVPLEEAEGIVCTGPFDELTETPEDYRDRFLLARTRGLSLLCANPDLVVDMGERRIYCAGALAVAYESMGGEVLYFGKPHPPIYDLVRRRLVSIGRSAETATMLAVGDGILTDIRGGRGEGIDTLFVTGGLEAARFGDDPAEPDPARLAGWLAQQTEAPTMAIGRLR